MNFETFLSDIREIIQSEDAPIVLDNGIWRVLNRESLWTNSSSRFFDAHLETFENKVIDVLSEIDPKFDLPVDQQYAAKIYGKNLKYSSQLREGLSETLALLGNNASHLENCSNTKPKSTVFRILKNILSRKEWRIWASLDDHLPNIAEADPDEFLHQLEVHLNQDPCIFDEIFLLEGDPIFGSTYITGILSALEALSWHEDYIVRSTTILARLASRDPGGRWQNRPINSLTYIFLPWLPQTFATFEKRRACITSIESEQKEIAWQLLLSLLPNQSQTSSGTYKPNWIMEIPSDWKPEVKTNEYHEQVNYYTEKAINLAFGDTEKLLGLLQILDNLPSQYLHEILAHISSTDITDLDEDERFPLWLKITKIARKHRRFSNAKWALTEPLIDDIEKSADTIKPTSIELNSIELFSQSEHELYGPGDNWRQQSEDIENSRIATVKEILGDGGLGRVLNFATQVESPFRLGYSLGKALPIDDDSALLPEKLLEKDEKIEFLINGFISSRIQNFGWKWVFVGSFKSWDNNLKSELTLRLPFTMLAWNIARNELNDPINDYWKHVKVEPYQSRGELSVAAKNLLSASRPLAALNCLSCDLLNDRPLDTQLVAEALLQAPASSEDEPSIDSYHLVELIKHLQDSPEFPEDLLFKVEWAYLPILESHNGGSPRLLKKRLSEDPSFFCEVIRKVYRSKHDTPDSEEQHDEQDETISTNCWRLLHGWNTPPGVSENLDFYASAFTEWLTSVKEYCSKSGHLEVALNHVGQVCFYGPSDPGGHWLDLTISRELNAPENEEMRRGLYSQALNSRGVHWVDPSAAPEKRLEENWRGKAHQSDDAGLGRLAATLRELAEHYRQEAEEILSSRR
ncbi:hypothetical protein [Microbulbifer agarilyticus]|uniref:hypothetical protein n=1 Tax=Microbulbifer agarilyticus TaxID=260552 RepID=UPI001CD22823|nr:hypothetical protein [Microbulbifer agarilyticus]MCA0899304.1 hypothetical protein [Microbulbifer agarilyticus]